VAHKSSFSTRRLGFEALERREVFSAGVTISSALFLASTVHENAASSPSALFDDPPAQAQGSAVNHAPSGTDKSIALSEDLIYTFNAADFGFSDPSDATAAPAGDIAEDHVLVLYNSASSTSATIANYYSQVHPGVRLLGITGVDPTSENITADDYLSIIRPQVLAALTPTTDVIVTTKGLPLRIAVTETPLPLGSTYVDGAGMTRTVNGWQPFSSLESELTRIDINSTWQMMGDQSYIVPGSTAYNPYYNKDLPFSFATYGIRLTSRLDGYTVADIEAAIDRAQQAYIGPNNSPNGPYYFLIDNDPSKSYGAFMDQLVTNVLTPAGLPVVYDNTSAFVGTAPGPIIGYDSHGVHQSSTPANYLLTGLTASLADGAVFESWESYNAYSFTTSNPHGNQGQLAQWIQIGGTAGVGNVEEPTATKATITNEDQMFQMLLAGYNFAEAVWSANRNLSFVNTLVGDPLMTWQDWPPVSPNALAAVKISTLPLAGSLSVGGVAVTAGQFVSAADIAAGRLSYAPAAHGQGANYASFTFQVQDDGGTAGGGADLDPTPNTITINVLGANDPPTAVNDAYLVNEDMPQTIAASGVLGNDSDPDGNPLTAVLGSGPSHGNLVLNANGSFTYTPTANYFGPDSFTYRASDGLLTSNLATVSLTILPVNDAPLASNDGYSTAEDTPLILGAPGVLANDLDYDGNPLTAILVTGPSHGSLTLNANGSFTYTPQANYNGADSFTYRNSDGALPSNVTVVSINVLPINDAPSGTDKTVTIAANATYTFTLSDFGFSDPNDSPANSLAAVKITTLPTAGSLTVSGAAVGAGSFVSSATIAAGLLKFSPAAGASGTGYANFGFQVRDNGGTSSGGVDLDPSPHLIAINVTPEVPVTPAPVSIWPGSMVPTAADSGDKSSVELGTKFSSDTSGFITGVRFYKSAANTGVHTASLWTTNGQLLATATFTSETASGWQQVNFAAPVAISANTTYVASYHTNTGRYAVNRSYFTSTFNSGPLHVPANGGVYLYGAGGFPTSSYQGSNYWVDVVLTTAPPESDPPTVTAMTPAGGSTNVGINTAASATFNEAMNPASINAGTVVLRDANNVTVPIAVAYNSATRTVTANPTTPLASATTYTLVVKGGAAGVKDLAGNALVVDAVSTFTTVAPSVSIWPGSTVPGAADSGDKSSVELGTKFTSDTSGFITGLRFYKSAANTGVHTASLWTANGQLLATATFISETASGWQQVSFAVPVAIAANTTYVASYHTNAGRYAVNRSYFASPYHSGPLHVPANGGVYLYGAGGFPTGSYQGSNYWVDPLFSAG